MSILKVIHSGPCVEYPGFEREITLIDDTKVVINICEMWSNETGWNFHKVYSGRIAALDSLETYLKIIKTQEAASFSKLVFNEDDIRESSSKINNDNQNRAIFLPDSGKGYQHMQQ